MSSPPPREEACFAKWISNPGPDALLMKTKLNINKVESTDFDTKTMCINILSVTLLE